MADTASAHLGAVTACATSDALDTLVVPGRATACRIADDELLLVCRPEVADEVVREVETRLTVLDPDAIVVETSDGWGGRRPRRRRGPLGLRTPVTAAPPGPWLRSG